jgi:hypothetical protein
MSCEFYTIKDGGDKKVPKGKISLTMDRDLIEFAKDYAEDQQTTVSEIVTQIFLHLKLKDETDPTEIGIRDPQFCESLMETTARIRSGKMEWHRYDEVF